MATSALFYSDLNEIKSEWSTNLDNFNEQAGEISALESFFQNTDNFEILEEASVNEEKLYSLQFKVQVNVKNEKALKCEIWLPSEYSNLNDLNEDNDATTPKNKTTTKFERSNSGKNAFTTINCSFLPYLLFDVTLPSTYPSLDMPVYQLKSNWLNLSQSKQICDQLNEIWSQNFNMIVLFTWIDFLQNNLIEFLDLFEEPNKLFLTPLDPIVLKSCDDTNFNTNFISLFISVDDMIFQFLRHNFIEETKLFRNSNQNCMVCFDEKIGSEFYRLNDCKHHFCVDCLTSMCQIHVKEGTIQLLKCPDNECKEYVPIEIMQQVLNNEEFDRWQRLLLQRTLDSMEDIIYCPKCNIPIIVDENDTHSFCLNCNLDYCRKCKSSWHHGPCLTEAMKVEKKLKNLNINMADLMLMTDEQIRERFGNNLNVVLCVKKEAVEADEKQKNNDFINKYVRCPKCRSPIDKYEGCNKVVCICGTILCYVCGKIINGYDHFNSTGSKCNLWNFTNINIENRVPERPQHQAQRAVERILAAAPDQRKNCMNCPSCGQVNLKVDKNNHLKCWLCATNFCFECRKRIIGNVSNHFKPGSACKQHSETLTDKQQVNKPAKNNNAKKNEQDDGNNIPDDFNL